MCAVSDDPKMVKTLFAPKGIGNERTEELVIEGVESKWISAVNLSVGHLVHSFRGLAAFGGSSPHSFPGNNVIGNCWWEFPANEHPK